MKWTNAAVEIIKNRYTTDGAVRLAKELGTTANAVTAKARRLGIDPTRKKPPKNFQWNETMLSILKNRYVEEGAEAIAAELNLCVSTVQHKAGELGLHTNAGHVRWGLKRASESKTVDIHYFDEWSPNMAYILGFLFADGCISKRLTDIRILIARKDEEILDFIKQELKSKQRIYRKEGGIDKRGSVIQPQSGLVISSTILVRAAMRLGLMPRKTYRDDPFPNVPDEMVSHFIRGYLDGDGCICPHQNGRSWSCSISFTGSCKFINGLRNKLTKLAGMRTHPLQFREGKGTDWACVTWSALEDLYLFRNFAYPAGFSFCLKRKKKRLDEWLSEPRRFWNLPTE